MFTPDQQQRLKDLAFPEFSDFTKTNSRLEFYVEQLMKSYPEKFHDKDTLCNRVFLDMPTSNIPMKYAVRSYEESPHRIKPV
jgi:hypothetical protein